jgi:hypothetical protein
MERYVSDFYHRQVVTSGTLPLTLAKVLGSFTMTVLQAQSRSCG